MNITIDKKNHINNKRSYLSFILPVFLLSSLLSACSGTIDPKAADYNSELGIRYLQQGRLKLANEKLLKALGQNSQSAQANHYFALLQQHLKVNDKANIYFKKAIQITPKDPELRNNYGSFLCDTNKANAAVQQFLSALKDPLYSTPEFAYTNAGICLRKAGKTNDAQAEKYFQLALKKKSSFPSALLQMSKLYKDRGNYAQAQAFMLRYEIVGKSSPEALKLCSIINHKLGDSAKAKTCRSTLLRIFPSSPEAEEISKAL